VGIPGSHLECKDIQGVHLGWKWAFRGVICGERTFRVIIFDEVGYSGDHLVCKDIPGGHLR
jgi:hypothetical protein